ncbi:hypothetical protein, partial [Burkholderia cepacia]|uniref:hypothetical protein n=1 Tax=Burkholderia cepacia TaxID=292 RepID=UPI001C897B6F
EHSAMNSSPRSSARCGKNIGWLILAGCCLPGLLALGLAQLPEIDPSLPFDDGVPLCLFLH